MRKRWTRDGCTCGDKDCFVCQLRAARLRAVRMIPLDVLPTGAARLALETLIEAGCYVRVLPPQDRDRGGAGTWLLWVDALAKARRDGDGTVPLPLWRLSWRHLCAKAGLTGVVAGLMALDELGEH